MNGAPLSRASRRATSVFPDAGGADHDDVVRGDLVPDVVGRLGPAPAVPDRDGDGLLGGLLADDVAVELRHDLAGRHLLQPGGGAGGSGASGAGGGVGHGQAKVTGKGDGERRTLFRSLFHFSSRQLQNR